MKKLLVCTDGSPYSEVCYDYAMWAARRTDATIDLLYVSDARQFELGIVSDVTGSLGVQPFQGLFNQLQEIEQEKVRLIKTRAYEIFKKHGFNTEKLKFHNRTGFLTDCLQEFEDDALGIDIIMIGKRGENANFATEHLGSTMERVVRSSKYPCFVTSRKYQEIHKILVAYDGSVSSNKVVQFLSRTHSFKDLELHLVSVTENDEHVEQLHKVEGILRESGYEPVVQILIGEPAEQIATYVEHKHIGCVCMGAYAHSMIRHMLIGSTTTDLIRRCRVPILLFR